MTDLPEREQETEADSHNLSEVGAYDSFRRANEHGLVILSMGLPYWMFRRDGRFHLCVEAESIDPVRDQISRYDRENRAWNLQPHLPAHPADYSLIPLYCIGFLLLFFFAAQQRAPAFFLEYGAVDAVAIISGGEWWRSVTALSLHVNIAHLVANLVSGGLFGWLVLRGFGSSFGSFLLLLSGSIGNLVTAYFYHPGDHFSVGASTMVFGAVGLLVGKAMLEMRHEPRFRGWRYRLIPPAVGFILLGLYGAGGENVDIAAHLFGMLAGIALGVPAHWIQWRLLRRSPWQYFFLVAASFYFCAAWFRALNAGP